MGKKRLPRTALALVGVAVVVLTTATPTLAAPGPQVSVSSPTAKVGDMVIVTLNGWPVGPVTVSVCGNRGARGSADCDLEGAQGVGIANSGTDTIVQLNVGRPPPPCPCVVRVADASNAVVRTVPIELVGIASGPVVASQPPGPLLDVKARISRGSVSLLDRLKESVGGSVKRTLVLEVKNLGVRSSPQIRGNAAVGRSVDTGEPLAMPVIAPLGPGQTKRYDVPVRLAAPSYGRYRISGIVGGYGVPVRFVTSTSTTPILLIALGFALTVDLVVLVVFRLRRRYWRASVGVGDSRQPVPWALPSPVVPALEPVYAFAAAAPAPDGTALETRRARRRLGSSEHAPESRSASTSAPLGRSNPPVVLEVLPSAVRLADDGARASVPLAPLDRPRAAPPSRVASPTLTPLGASPWQDNAAPPQGVAPTMSRLSEAVAPPRADRIPTPALAPRLASLPALPGGNQDLLRRPTAKAGSDVSPHPSQPLRGPRAEPEVVPAMPPAPRLNRPVATGAPAEAGERSAALAAGGAVAPTTPGWSSPPPAAPPPNTILTPHLTAGREATGSRAVSIPPGPSSFSGNGRSAAAGDVVAAAAGSRRTAPARPAEPFFQSTKAAVATCVAVAALLLTVFFAARTPTSSGVQPAAAGTRVNPSAPPSSGPAKTSGNSTAASVANQSGQKTSTTIGPGGGAQTTVTVAVAPAVVSVDNTTNLKDGQPVTVRVTADKGSQMFGFEVRLCAGAATIRFDSDMRPTQGGKCITKPLSPKSDDDQVVRSPPPLTTAETNFRVGVGTDQFVTEAGRSVTIACGPGHPCELALKIQYPGGFAFRTYPVTYGP